MLKSVKMTTKSKAKSLCTGWSRLIQHTHIFPFSADERQTKQAEIIVSQFHELDKCFWATCSKQLQLVAVFKAKISSIHIDSKKHYAAHGAAQQTGTVRRKRFTLTVRILICTIVWRRTEACLQGVCYWKYRRFSVIFYRCRHTLHHPLQVFPTKCIVQFAKLMFAGLEVMKTRQTKKHQKHSP